MWVDFFKDEVVGGRGGGGEGGVQIALKCLTLTSFSKKTKKQKILKEIGVFR